MELGARRRRRGYEYGRCSTAAMLCISALLLFGLTPSAASDSHGGAHAPDASAPCPAKPCPGPAHPGRTYCPSITTPGQCDHPTHPPCPPCGPSPPPLPPSPPKPTHRPWLEATLPIPKRVSLLMSQMTFEEKLLQLVMADLRYGLPPPHSRGVPPNETSKVIALGGWGATAASGAAVGPPGGPHRGVDNVDVERDNGDSCSPPGGIECKIANLRYMQLQFLNHTRLGIPVSFVEETSHAGGSGSTVFPMGVTQGATWNTSLAHAVGEAIALEARSWGIDRGLSPEINVCTDPRFGRTEENFGEDPAHVAAFAVAAVTGLQGGTASPAQYLPDNDHIVCEAKHCCAYGAGGRDGNSADISPKTLHDVYLRPWDSFVRAGGRGMMLSHNELNGVQMHANHDIMTEHFRNRLGYEGFFASDLGNIEAVWQNSAVAANYSDAVSLSLWAGMDQSFDSPGNGFDPSKMYPAIADGLLNESWVDRACAKILAQKFAARLFDGALPDPANHVNINSPQHRALARQVAAEGSVLLINDGILPLTQAKLANITKVAVIGPNSGCVGDEPAPPPPVPGQCASTDGIDCGGSFDRPGDGNNNIAQHDNVKSESDCCTLCLNVSNCTAAVYYGRGHPNQGRCQLKTVCDAPTASKGSTLVHTGRKPPRKSEGATPVGCHAQNGMIGGYSDLGPSDMSADNHAHIVTILEAVRSGVSGRNISVSYNHGVHVGSLDTSGIGDAQTAANQSDLAIVVVGDSAEGVGYNGSASCGEGADRPSIDLAGVQLDLLDAILATGTPTIVILVHGRPVSFGQDHGGAVTSKFGPVPLYMRVNALVAAWRPGVEGGHALWELLTGKQSFSGRLAQAWPHSAGYAHIGGVSPWYSKYCSEECPHLTMDMVTDTHHGLSLDPTSPAFPFGYGLDYLNVTYTNSSVELALNPMDEATLVPIQVHVNLLNQGGMAGQYVVQAYFTPPPSVKTRLTRYRYMLGGFTKIHIAPNGTSVAVVGIPRANLQHWNPRTAEYVLDSGVYIVYVCHDTRGLGGARGGASVSKEIELPAGHPSGPCLSHSVALH